MAVNEEKTQTQKAVAFTKDALLLSYEFKKHKDLLNIVLQNGKEYTKDEVRALLEKKLKRKVVI